MPIYLPSGWSMFGYTCVESRDLPEAFISIQESVISLKIVRVAPICQNGVFGIGNLQYARGYQINLAWKFSIFNFVG